MGTVTRPMGVPFEFRIKTIPAPVAMVGGVKEGIIKKGLLVASGAVIPKMENFDFELKTPIIGFKVSTIVKGFIKEEVSSSGNFTPAQISLMQSIPTNGKIYFEDIKAKMPDGRTVPLNAIILKVL